MNELRNEEEGLSNPSSSINEPNTNEQLMELAASFDNNDTSSPSHSKYSPINLLSFCKRRTIEHYNNISLSELSGSLGDLGTFIPLTVALARERKIALAPALFWAGVSNIITGYTWDVPMCVQPMKSISAVALTDTNGSGNVGLDAQSVTTAGILTGGAVLLLGVTNLIEIVNWIVPLTVVCGLQIGVGIRLASKGMTDIQKLPWGGGYDCIGMAVACALLSMFWLRDSGSQKDKKKQEQAKTDSEGNTRNDVMATTGANSATSSDEDVFQENDNVEMGKVLNNSHQLETATSLNPRSSVSTTAHTNETFDFAASSAPSSTPRQQKQLSYYLRKVWSRACCCLNPFPKTPHPVGIYLFLIGCIFAAVTLATAGPDSGYDLPLYFFGAPVAINAMKDVTSMSWWNGFLQGALPQLPLTTLNSVISVCCLAHTLYPDKRDPVLEEKHRTDAVITRREVSISVGLMNLILVPLGSMPNCHGAGGLAGQHRFGARTGTSVVILGVGKVLLAIFLGGSALTLLDALPIAVLSIMIAIAGLELVSTGVKVLFECVQKEKEKTMKQQGNESVNGKAILQKNATVAMVTAAVIIALKKTHYGALSGWVVHVIYGDGFRNFVVWIQKKRAARS
eukprot:CAMPEP_0113393020 /NCGR_PEP_ID=MMETSP0013_2-20120614/11620_1 /TAXON_ID=2843 ORGANISM="Skeletonema costatum, Strain 1716" /NCGR_SAMPLE_ID=MMETSP0013_2 /ASSEMBLY_ACC=CAM_ASM_000158 /LENGTH=623 /DNA_ID=CAMNT_0000276501 /DNA_START=181 /DNA_END=2052 /DNA_ORIENTATION=+ /assembly_acc=CAM_ASM_000158